jgi:hypothetical protein
MIFNFKNISFQQISCLIIFSMIHLIFVRKIIPMNNSILEE